MWGDTFGVNDSHFEAANDSKDKIVPGTDEKMINWFELPSVIRSHIEKRINDAR